jgi:poly-gamma-glutamate synthesis protein (capsule biosynthesis protein)
VNEVTLLACGDVGPVHEPVSGFCTLVRQTLAAADLRFAQVERVYSDRGALQVHSGGRHTRLPPQMASIFTDCGFDVVSVASNHAMDWGADAMLDSIETLQERGIRTVGAGRTIEDARAPAIVERNGVRVAFLAYCSVLREGYAADAHHPGVAPLRVRTYYEAVDYQPGIPPHVVTVPYEDDLASVVEDVKRARSRADVVIVSLHWGLHFIPRAIAEYQPAVARSVLQAGADLILGHHAHVPKAVGVHEGKVCFYSLSNFIMSAPPASAERRATFEKRYGARLDPEYPNLPYGVDAKRTLIAKAALTAKGVSRVSFLPVLIDKKLRPEVLKASDARFAESLQYMEWCSEDFDHAFEVEGDEVVVRARNGI